MVWVVNEYFIDYLYVGDIALDNENVLFHDLLPFGELLAVLLSVEQFEAVLDAGELFIRIIVSVVIMDVVVIVIIEVLKIVVML